MEKGQREVAEEQAGKTAEQSPGLRGKLHGVWRLQGESQEMSEHTSWRNFVP